MDEPSRRPTRLHVAVDWNRAFTFFLNQQCNSDVKGRDLVHIEAGSKCWIETYTGAVVITRAGLCTFTSLGNVFTIVCGTWDLLKTWGQNAGPNIIEEITEACHTQESLESDGHRTRHDTICTQDPQKTDKGEQTVSQHHNRTWFLQKHIQGPSQAKQRGVEDRILKRERGILGTKC